MTNLCLSRNPSPFGHKLAWITELRSDAKSARSCGVAVSSIGEGDDAKLIWGDETAGDAITVSGRWMAGKLIGLCRPVIFGVRFGEDLEADATAWAYESSWVLCISEQSLKKIKNNHYQSYNLWRFSQNVNQILRFDIHSQKHIDIVFRDIT